jgi:glycosyltransferase involved in cell wall biosynthesis
MASYNSARYIREQVMSILEQLRDEDELVIVDDASSDQTREEIASFNDRRLRMFVHLKNQGVVESFEEAVRRATGDILFLSDGDDIWAPKKVQRVLQAFNDYPEAKIVATAIRIIDEKGRSLGDDFYQKDRNFTPALLPNILRNRFQGSAMAFRASLRDLVLPFPKRKVFLHDAWIGMCNCVDGGDAVYIDEPLLYYRRHGNNLSRNLGLRLQVTARLQLLLALTGRLIKRRLSLLR